ncbi:hypothetical protein AB0G32_31830 [Streptomyces sp. NPDC023723]|uniref:hypothetical protein n=1 Tax=Streptomyces sp. NPDC023723 TaxID=3154323 RepID=UPI00340F05A6
MTALQSTAGNTAVQRLFQGGLSGATVDQVLLRLKERFPGSRPRFVDVRNALNSPTVYTGLDDLGAALGLDAAQQQSEATSAPRPGPASTASPMTTPAAHTPVPAVPTPATDASAPVPAVSVPATTGTGRPARPTRPKPSLFPRPEESGERSDAATRPVRTAPPVPGPKPAGFPRAGQQSTSAAGHEQTAAEPVPAPHVPTAEPPAPQVAGSAERISVAAFAANTAKARTELEVERTTPRRYLRRRAASKLDNEVFKAMAGSVRLNNKQQLMDQFINQLYSCLEWTGRAPIAVYTDEAQGKGDLMLGVKTADALRENFPRTEQNKYDIALLTSQTAHDSQPGVFAGAQHPFAVLDGTAPRAPQLGPGPGPTHTIVAPQLGVTRNFQESVGAWHSEVSAMTEYSKKEGLPSNAAKATGHTTGLGTDEVGITFHPGLRAYKAQQNPKDSEERRRAARLDHLQALKSKELLTALFPEDQEQAVKSFAGAVSSRLYCAYSNKSALRFALTVAEVENGSGNDVHILQSSPNSMPELDDAVRRDLAELGVGEVRLVQFIEGRLSTEATLDTGGPGKKMHWITTDKVPHDDMLTLIKASEPIMMTTGNQSTSEALSAGKTIMYESIGMPQSQAFRQSLYGGAGVRQPDIDSIAAISRDRDRPGVQGPPGRPEYAAAATALRRMQQEDRMGAFSDKAAATKDLGNWIGGSHLRAYLKKTGLKGDLEREEERLLQPSSYRDAAAYRRFVDFLQGLPETGE